MKLIILIFCLIGACSSAPYVPGEPGGEWSEEELRIVKAKIHAIFTKGVYAMELLYGKDELYDGGRVKEKFQGAGPSAPKAIRLIFHDCLRYTDGTGGCDGCLNWKGVGYRYPNATEQRRFKVGLEQFENVGETNNNGVEYMVEVLEAVYTDPKYPQGMAPELDISLRDSGKSRADLWAYAAILAVEYGIDTNNMVCDGTFNSSPVPQCNQEKGKSTCKVTIPRPMKFKTGRSDCTEHDEEVPYKATKDEHHPSAVGNGKMTLDFFKEAFNFNSQEVIALMGAHTMGAMHAQISLFRYLWTTASTESFNNHYYRNIVGEDRYAIDDDKSCTMITDAEGRKPKTRWVASTREKTKNGGPTFWIHENYRCPNCVTRKFDGAEVQWNLNGKSIYPQCCDNLPSGQFCRPDSAEMEDDDDVERGCERWAFNWGIDEMALNSEMGLYLDFEVTDDGIPYGCPGLETFKTEYWFGSTAFTWSVLPKPNITRFNPKNAGHYYKADPLCEVNRFRDGSNLPNYRYFEIYAKNQNRWVRDFYNVYEKMLANGYESGLVNSPYEGDKIVCPRLSGPPSKFYQTCDFA